MVEHIYPEWDVLVDSESLPQKGYFQPALLVIDGKFYFCYKYIIYAYANNILKVLIVVFQYNLLV